MPLRKAAAIFTGYKQLLDLKEIFGNAKFYEFAIRGYSYNLDEMNPMVTIEVGHFRLKGLVKITFKEVYFHSAMSESFIHMNDEDSWAMDVFLAKAKNSKLIPWLASYTLLGSEHVVEVSELSHYRVFAQDHFIDVLCAEKPMLMFQNAR